MNDDYKKLFFELIEIARIEGANRIDEYIPDNDKEEAYRLGANDMLDDLYYIIDNHKKMRGIISNAGINPTPLMK